jgi:hypothetical protein
MGLVRGLKDAVSKEVLRRRFGHGDFRRIRFVWGDLWKEWYMQNGASSEDLLRRLKSDWTRRAAPTSTTFLNGTCSSHHDSATPRISSVTSD